MGHVDTVYTYKNIKQNYFPFSGITFQAGSTGGEIGKEPVPAYCHWSLLRYITGERMPSTFLSLIDVSSSMGS